MIKHRLLQKARRPGVIVRGLFTGIRHVFILLIFLVSLVGMSPTPVLAGSSGLICETFDAYVPGSRIGSYTGWVDGGSGDAGPTVTGGIGLAGSTGLGAGKSIFNWTAHAFNWNDTDFQKINLQGDFQTNGSGQFDDDRLSWTIDGASNSSNNQFGVQLDPAGIVTYWSNVIGSAKINDVIVPLSGLTSSAWYRFTAEITKLTATSAKIDVSLVLLDASGNPTGTPITGSIADTSALASGETPAAGYFTPTVMYPSYKNYNATTGAADNTCYEIFTSVSTIQYSLDITDDGHGSVTLNPAGGIYNEGAVVTLTPVPALGYEFDAWSGANTSDLIDNGNGTWSITMDADKAVAANFVELSSVANTALQFNGTNQFVTFGSASGLGVTNFTIETWFQRTGTGTRTSTGNGGVTAIPLVSKGMAEADGSNKDANYFLGIGCTGASCTGNTLVADFEDTTTTTNNHPLVGVTQIPADNMWHHAAASYNASTGIFSLYLDGQLENSITVASGKRIPRSDSIQHAAIGTALNSCGTPGGACGASGAQSPGYFAGVMDEARVWNVVRSQSEIQADMYSELTSGAGLVARWGMNESAGDTINSSAGTFPGILTNGPTWVSGFPPPVTTPPAVPSGLTAVASEAYQVHLTWNDNASDETGFELERSTNGVGGVYGLLATPVVNATSFDDGNVEPVHEYCYRIRAVNGFGPSEYHGPQCVTTPTEGNHALDFGGTNAYVNFVNPAELHLAQFTLETWFRRDGTGDATTTGTGGIANATTLIARGRGEAENPSVDLNYFLGIDTVTNVLIADFEEGASGTSPSLNHPVSGSTVITNGVWHHAAATYDGTTWRLYLDGVLDGQVTVGQPPAAAGNQYASIGAALTSTGVADGYFNGMIDEARVWNHALSMAEIQANINQQLSNGTGLVARWGLNEGSGTVVRDSVSPASTGTITGTNYVWDAGAPFNLSFNQAPNPPTDPSPAPGSFNVSVSPTLAVTVTDPEADPMDVTFYGRSTGGTGEDFSIIVLPDTQFYSESYPSTFTAQTQWIVNNAAALNIEYVAHEGDIVNVAGNETQWINADAAMDLLDTANIPYGVVPGNHDEGSLYNNYFGVSRFAGKSFYGGQYPSGDNSNNYTLFSAGGMDFIVLNLDYSSPASGSLTWADNLLTTYSNRRAIVISHSLVDANGNFDSWGNQVYNALKAHSNLFLMMNGHTFGEARRSDSFNGNTVYSLLADYQSRSNGGDGWLRILQFSPANDTISVKTYSPTLGAYETDANSQFTLAYDMGGSSFEMLGTVSNVPSGGSASIGWPTPPALQHNTQYEWYVNISDGSRTTQGPAWSFTTIPPECYALTVGKTGNGTVPTASPNKSQVCASEGMYVEGEPVSLTGALPGTGSYISSWYGTANDGSTADSNTLVMPNHTQLAGVNYLPHEYSVTANVLPLGSGVVSFNNSGPFHNGDSVQLTATPATGWIFTGWSGDLTGSDNPANLTIDGNEVVTANFAQIEYTLNITTLGNGAVIKSPDQTTYHHNDVVTITPNPETGWTFSNWGGDAGGSTNPVQITIDGDKNITATFTQLCYALTIAVDPLATGSITANPAPNCEGGTKYAHGTSVQLTGNAGTGYGFDHWGGNLSGTNNPQTITMDSAKNVTAVFAANAVSLTVNVSPAGSGSVTRGPVGPYFYGADVTLTANAPTGWHFVEWTGGLTGNINPAVVTMTGDKTVTAVFARDPVTLTVAVAEGGSVTRSPGGPYLYGDTVQLTATPAIGWHFVQWGGNLSGSANPVNITLDGNKTVSVTFARDEYTLSVSVMPPGSGTVTRDLDKGTYYYGEVVTLTANANSGWSFTGWGGDISGTTSIQSVPISGDTNVVANFTQTTVTHSIALQPGWNLVSFNLHPISTDIKDVLSSIQGNYDLVYAWDATGAHAGSGNWMKYDNIPLSPDTLSTLDETMGFWIHMTAADILDVLGTVPAASNIALKNDAGGWNLVAYPSAVNGPLPGVIGDHGVGTSFSLVYAYHANNVADRWKLFDRTAPAFANDLTQLAPGWGYWIKVSADNTWNVTYAAP